MHPSRLPHTLGRGFTVQEALAAGVSSSRLRTQELERPFHGGRSTGHLTGFDRLQLLMRLLPEHVFACGTTAAVVFGIPLPAAIERDAFGIPMIAMPYPRNRVRRAGTRGRSVRVEERELVRRRGIEVTNAVRTWRDLSPLLDVPAMVAATDFLIARRRRLATIEELTAEHEKTERLPGARNRRLALELCSTHAESPRESELRCMLVLAGLPMPECNVEIFDGARFVARVDIIYRAQKLVVEYYGDHHRDPDQWSRDEMRRAELESLGYRVTVVTRRDFDDLPALAARVRRLLAT